MKTRSLKKKMKNMKFSALLGANESGTHRLKPAIVGKAAKPRAFKDCMHELPVVFYNAKMLGSLIPF